MTGGSGAVDRRVRKIVSLLEERGCERISVAELAQSVGLGPSRLEHLFKLDARMSIRDFIRERRLEEAALLLAGSEERISTIGYQVGFTDPSNFNHAFKRRFGVSPREYREQRREAPDESLLME